MFPDQSLNWMTTHYVETITIAYNHEVLAGLLEREGLE
jgi:hypothetical protein